MKTAYILGAGCSAASDLALPVMRGFFDKGLDEFPAVAAFLATYYGHEDSSKYDLEDVLSYLDTRRSMAELWATRGMGLATESYGLYGTVVDFVRARLRVPDDAMCERHVELVRLLKSADSVISLNYDLVLDQALRGSESRRPGASSSRVHKLATMLGRSTYFGGTPAAVKREDLASGSLIKLHGSLDWLWCPRSECPNHATFDIPDLGESADKASRVCAECGADLEVFIVPPTASKRLTGATRLALVWRLAFEVLKSADNVVAIGLSLAHTDVHLHWLLREARLAAGKPLERLIVVNPDLGASERARRLLPVHSAGYVWHQSLDHYLGSEMVRA